MRIKKVKYKADDRKVSIVYEQEGPSGWDELSLASNDEPRPELLKSMKDLSDDVLMLCEIPDKRPDEVLVTGVSYSYGGEKEVMGACIVAQIKLRESYSPLNVVTPHKTSESYSDYEDQMALFEGGTTERLKVVQEEALRYVNGDRAQQNLFSEKAL